MRRGSDSRRTNRGASVRAIRRAGALTLLLAIATLAAASITSRAAPGSPCDPLAPQVPIVTAPLAAPDPAGITSTTATVSATIDPNGFDTEYTFQVVDSMGRQVAASDKQTLDGDVGSPPVTVEATITGLAPGKLYYFGIDASNICGSYESSDPLTYPSPLLSPSFRTLSHVDVILDGEGSVSRSGGSLDCQNGTCSADYGSSVTLTASPTTGGLFLGWTGDCVTTSTSCTLTKRGAATVIAHFGWAPLLNVVMAGPGSGRVTSSPGGIDCVTGTPTGCSASFSRDSTVTLTAVPDPGSVFVGWGSDETSCTGTALVCTKKMAASTYVTAEFAPAFQLVVSVDSGSGRGTVTSTPAGISCPGICNAYFAPGTEVTLTATPKPSSTFAGWDGACFDRSPQAPCSLVIYSDTELNAEFSNPLVELAGGGAVVRIDQSRNGKTVKVRRGDLLQVSLPAAKATGFVWQVRSLDRRALQPLGSGYVQQPTDGTPALGVPGTYTLSLKALKKSRTTVKLFYSRAGGKAVRTFRLRVVVR
jgi:predicted secreted protein